MVYNIGLQLGKPFTALYQNSNLNSKNKKTLKAITTLKISEDFSY